MKLKEIKAEYIELTNYYNSKIKEKELEISELKTKLNSDPVVKQYNNAIMTKMVKIIKLIDSGNEIDTELDELKSDTVNDSHTRRMLIPFYNRLIECEDVEDYDD